MTKGGELNSVIYATYSNILIAWAFAASQPEAMVENICSLPWKLTLTFLNQKAHVLTLLNPAEKWFLLCGHEADFLAYGWLICLIDAGVNVINPGPT